MRIAISHYDQETDELYAGDTPIFQRAKVNNGIRPKLLMFGNSLAGQSCIYLASGQTTTTAAAVAGASTITVAAIGAIVAGSKIAVQSYEQTVAEVKVLSVAGNIITLTEPLKKMVRLNALVQLYTTSKPTNIRSGGGAVSSALALLGQPVDLLQGYGYGGGSLAEIVIDLPNQLEQNRPAYVMIIAPENSIAHGVSLAELIRQTKYMLATCQSYGAIAFISTAWASNSYSAAQAATYDGYNDFVRGCQAEFPQAVPCDVGKQWIDPAQPTLRAPLAGWTDGVHPLANKFFTIGTYFRDAMRAYLPAAKSMLNYSLLPNSTLSGAGGGAVGLQAGSVVPANTDYTAYTMIATTSAAAVGSRLQLSVPGLSDVNANQLVVKQRFNFALNGGCDGQRLAAYLKYKAANLTGCSMVTVALVFSGGESYSVNQNGGQATDPAMLGTEIQIETVSTPVPFGSTWVDCIVMVYVVSGLNNGVNIDLNLMEIGIIPSARG